MVCIDSAFQYVYDVFCDCHFIMIYSFLTFFRIFCFCTVYNRGDHSSSMYFVIRALSDIMMFMFSFRLVLRLVSVHSNEAAMKCEVLSWKNLTNYVKTNISSVQNEKGSENKLKTKSPYSRAIPELNSPESRVYDANISRIKRHSPGYL